MPLRLNVGASQKVSDNHYGSKGASVTLEVELGGAILHEPDKLQTRIRKLFALVRQAVQEELHRNGAPATPTPPAPPPVPASPPPAANGNGKPNAGGVRPATPAQCKALYALARQQGLTLADWLQERTQVRRPDDLTVRQASTLIDVLRATSVPTGT